MSDSSNQHDSPLPEEFLAHILDGLSSASAQARLAAIQELLGQNYSSHAILRKLEEMALKDKSKSVREAAQQALTSPTHRYIQSRTSTLNRRERQFILNELTGWEIQGLIQAEQAGVIRRHYDFDLTPPTPAPQRLEAAPLPETGPVPIRDSSKANDGPAASSPSLTQTLLSETSIKIALYLGAFFVIAAAAILAAVVEAARLPILLAATALFGGGALAIKKRLPQPSFALFIVFSFLLPTDANVLADILALPTKANAGYWFVALAAMALIWAFGTWFYASRLFSLAAFVSLAISFGRFGELLETELEIYLQLFCLVTYLGLGGVYLLKRWAGTKTSLLLFILTQISQLCLTAFALATVLIRVEDSPSAWNLLSALFWLSNAGFYVLSNLLYPSFVLFPWLAAAALYPVPLVFMATFDAQLPWYAAASWTWGALLAAASEVLRRFSLDSIRRYSFPALVVSLLILMTSVVLGFAEETIYGFASLLAAALLYTILHILQPRFYIWITALLLGLGAYFSFFALPFMERYDVFAGYQLLIASLLLLLPELILRPEFSIQRVWRNPTRILGGLIVIANTVWLVLAENQASGEQAIIHAIYAVFFIIYALRYRNASLGYGATTFTALSIIFVLRYFDLAIWLPVLTGLAALYFLSGWVLKERDATVWSGMMRISGLVLGGLVALVALVKGEHSGGWYLMVTTALFTAELFLRRDGWLESGPQFFFPAALFMLLRDFEVRETAWFLLGIGLLWLVLDLAFGRTFSGTRPLRWPARALGGLATGVNTLYLLVDSTREAGLAAICFAVYAAFFLLFAVLHRRAWLGYGLGLFSMLTLIQALGEFDLPNWLLPVTALGILFYALGFARRRLGEDNLESWPFVLWTSGMGIALVASLAAPFKGDLVAAIPPAVAATLIAVEALQRRNVWLGFPANALYLMAYFILLVELHQDEPQFYSIATAALGLFMHYLLTRTGSKTGAFFTGMVSQLVLLGTTYIQFLSNERLAFFAILFFQALAVLVYGIIIRSRSLVITPIIFAVLAVLTVLYGLLQDTILPVILIGCTGLLLLLLGILAVVMRERWKQIGERFGDWGA
jgi:hypothetical protein